MKILSLILTILFVSCGELERVDPGVASDSVVGTTKYYSVDEKLEASEILLLRDICSGLSAKNDYIKLLINTTPTLSRSIINESQSCDDTKVTKTVITSGFSESIAGVVSLSDSGLLFDKLVTDTTTGLSEFCTASSGLEVNRQQLNATQSLMTELNILANNNSRCGASSSYVCISVGTSMKNIQGSYDTAIEDIYVIHKTKAEQNILKRRDRKVLCTDKKSVSIISQGI